MIDPSTENLPTNSAKTVNTNIDAHFQFERKKSQSKNCAQCEIFSVFFQLSAPYDDLLMGCSE